LVLDSFTKVRAWFTKEGRVAVANLRDLEKTSWRNEDLEKGPVSLFGKGFTLVVSDNDHRMSSLQGQFFSL
jgi:hypothetical protein